jgi:predicted HTH domain antitoxin
MIAITIQIPDDLAEDMEDIKQLIASKLYESGRLSLGQAADVAGLSKRAFAEALRKYGVSYINYSVEDLKDELEKH